MLRRWLVIACIISVAQSDEGALKSIDDSAKDVDKDAQDATRDAQAADKGMHETAKGISSGNLKEANEGMEDTVKSSKEGMSSASDAAKTVNGNPSTPSAGVGDKAAGVGGHMAMDVAKTSLMRRLQDVTGFSTDDNAIASVKKAIAKKAQTAEDNVHTVQSESAAPTGRRLLTTNSTVMVNYTVDCPDSVACQQVYTLLHMLAMEELTEEVMADLKENGASPYTVVVTKHDVDMVPCAIFGVGYNDSQRNDQVNGAYRATAFECQQSCESTVFCEVFTWYKDSGGCWLQGNGSQLHVYNDNAVSGPVKCPPKEATVLAKEAGEAAASETLGAAPASDGNAGMGAIGLGIAGVVAAGAVGLGVAAYTMGSGEKKKKKKKEGKTSRAVELSKQASEPEAAPLVSSEVPAVQAPIQFAQVPNPVYYYSGFQPVAMEPMAMAEPSAMYPGIAATPVYSPAYLS